jgi:hypothetical protein
MSLMLPSQGAETIEYQIEMPTEATSDELRCNVVVSEEVMQVLMEVAGELPPLVREVRLGDKLSDFEEKQEVARKVEIIEGAFRRLDRDSDAGLQLAAFAAYRLELTFKSLSWLAQELEMKRTGDLDHILAYVKKSGSARSYRARRRRL